MQKKLTLSSDDIFNKEFSLQYKGYVPQEVDDFLDEVLKNYENKIQDQAEIINSISERFEEQQERMDRLELTLEKILSAIEDIDDTKLQKKVDKLDKQLTQLSSSIEKLTSYVDE